MTGLRLALFDCDGTLVDSQASIVAAMGSAFAACGLPAPEPGLVRSVVGLSLPQAILRLAPEADAPEVSRLGKAYQAAYAALRRPDGPLDPLFPGMLEVLDALEAAGVLLGIVTGKSRKGLIATLESHNLSGRFVTLVTADDAPGKPHPGMAEMALETVGATPRQAVVIGDTVFDMEMAKAAGTGAIGVSWGYHAPEALRASGAALVVDEAAALPPAIGDMLGTDGLPDRASRP
ncbi:MAG: HAD-IA family hydrolase [Alphaproteobacteria bacterium]|jgi:phosphoglycolate phosphatase|nr:HAD-IA family hydrolase [Alphaproteobacteria bacterium]